MDYAIARRRMVERHIKGRGITDPRVLEVMEQIPRHLFVEDALRSQAYGDYPLPIGHKQTISQPFMVASMTEALQLKGDEAVLEIGTGSGYQTAVLSQLARKVYSIERIGELGRQSRRILDRLGCINVNIRITDGTVGWEDAGPFDAILVTAGAPDLPMEYLRQLVTGGRLVIPIGDRHVQTLTRFTLKPDGKVSREKLFECRFVPLIGSQGWEDE